MITFSVNCSDEEIRNAVVAWSELLAKGKFAEALSMFLNASDSLGFAWTPEHLEDWVSRRMNFQEPEYLLNEPWWVTVMGCVTLVAVFAFALVAV
jgi:hypothetical protein